MGERDLRSFRADRARGKVGQSGGQTIFQPLNQRDHPFELGLLSTPVLCHFLDLAERFETSQVPALHSAGVPRPEMVNIKQFLKTVLCVRLEMFARLGPGKMNGLLSVGDQGVGRAPE
jgi:hypothetical protein